MSLLPDSGMLIAVLAAALVGPHTAPPRTERLMALARLDAAVHYFDPAVAIRASSWDSLFAANAVRIVDARGGAEYQRLIAAMMQALHVDAPAHDAPQRALVYDGFPTAQMQSSGGYQIHWRSAGTGETYRVEMGEGVHVDVSISEPGADTTESVRPLPPPSTAEWLAKYPTPGYRILAAARIWSTIRLFYPYKSLIGENWDEQLRRAFPEFEHARDSLEYVQAIARFTSHIHDTHVTVGSAVMYSYLGAVPIGADARIIQDQLVITRIVDSSASRAGLRAGDVVVSVDGEPTNTRIARLTPFFAASTPQALRYRLESTLLRGQDSSPARLVVHGATGGDRTLIVPRSAVFVQRLVKHRTGSIIRLLPGNVGYVDLDRLPPAMVDSAFRMLANTKAIVFDDRGYPLGTAWSIGPRLNTHPDPTVAAKFRRLIVSSPDTARTTVYQFDQPIPPGSNVPKYTGRTVLLVDERTISQAEHTGLFFEAANGTTFIGSRTMGANGDVTVFALPGAISVSFTGHDVRHADGRQLQRVGLEPQVAVTPTIAGVRAGHDEVLEAAVEYVGGTGVIPPDTLHETVSTQLATLPDEPYAVGWSGTRPGAYRIGLDRTIAHQGSSSGHITARSLTPEGFATLTQMLRADSVRGKRVRLSGFVKTHDVTGSAGLWLRVDGNGGMLAFDNMAARPVRGTRDWTRVSVVLDVPADADGLALGFLMQSGGEAWIDDMSLEVVGSDVPSTNMVPPSANPANAGTMRAMYRSAPAVLANPGFEGN